MKKSWFYLLMLAGIVVGGLLAYSEGTVPLFALIVSSAISLFVLLVIGSYLSRRGVFK